MTVIRDAREYRVWILAGLGTRRFKPQGFCMAKAASVDGLQQIGRLANNLGAITLETTLEWRGEH